jgi:hypothetical protein
VKPGEDSNRGTGIHVVKSLKEIEQRIKECESIQGDTIHTLIV